MAKKRINPLQSTLTTALILAECAGIVLSVRATHDGIYSIPVALVGGGLLTLIPASILERLVHQYVYHCKRFGSLTQIHRIHHQGHHAAIFPTWRYTTNRPVRRHPVSEPDISRLYAGIVLESLPILPIRG